MKQKPKPKILIWCDSPTAPTGFGNVARNLFDELHKWYEIDIVGINYYGLQKYDHTKWHIYPVQQQDMLGQRPIQHAISHNEYDVIILFQDHFHISKLLPELKKHGSAKTKHLVYFPVDGGPLYSGWKNIFTEADKVITYTKYAINTIKESYPDIDVSTIDYLYHGVDPAFFKLSKQMRKSTRNELKWHNRFVAININRYQPRKNIFANIRAWSLFAKGYKLCKCGNAYPKNLTYCDSCRLPHSNVIEETMGHKDVSLYMHMRLSEPVNGPGASNSLPALCAQVGITTDDLKSGLVFLQAGDIYRDPYPVEHINQIYNAADINVSFACGEGAGLSLIEAAATGTTSLAPRNSAIIEMLEGYGILIDNVPNGMYSQPFDNSFRRPNVDTLKFAQELENQYQLWKKNGRKKIINNKAIEIVKDKFQWQPKRDYLHAEIIKLIK